MFSCHSKRRSSGRRHGNKALLSWEIIHCYIAKSHHFVFNSFTIVVTFVSARTTSTVLSLSHGIIGKNTQQSYKMYDWSSFALPCIYTLWTLFSRYTYNTHVFRWRHKLAKNDALTARSNFIGWSWRGIASSEIIDEICRLLLHASFKRALRDRIQWATVWETTGHKRS